MHDQGNSKAANVSGDAVVFNDGTGQFCNFSIDINGEFQIIPEENDLLCLDVDGINGQIDVDTESNCLSNNGDGETWDRCTATEEGLSGSTKIWEFVNQYNGDCIYDDAQEPAIYAACGTDEFEFFIWPGSNL
jgi:hypothetical protein